MNENEIPKPQSAVKSTEKIDQEKIQIIREKLKTNS